MCIHTEEQYNREVVKANERNEILGPQDQVALICYRDKESGRFQEGVWARIAQAKSVQYSAGDLRYWHKSGNNYLDLTHVNALRCKFGLSYISEELASSGDRSGVEELDTHNEEALYKARQKYLAAQDQLINNTEPA